MRIHITEILLFFSFTVEKSKKLLNTEKACWEIRITRVLNQGKKAETFCYLIVWVPSSPLIPPLIPIHLNIADKCNWWKKKKFLISFYSSISNIPWAYHIFYEWPNPQQITCLSPDVLKMSYDLFACLSQKMIEVKKHSQTQGSPDKRQIKCMYLVRVITVSRTWGWEELGAGVRVGASPGSVLIMSVDLIYPQFIANTVNESLLETTSSLFKHLKEACVWVWRNGQEDWPYFWWTP